MSSSGLREPSQSQQRSRRSLFSIFPPASTPVIWVWRDCVVAQWTLVGMIDLLISGTLARRPVARWQCVLVIRQRFAAPLVEVKAREAYGEVMDFILRGHVSPNLSKLNQS
jgi:hypothetical protein